MASSFVSSQEVFDWLDQFINYDTNHSPPKFRPERMQIIAELAGHPERCAPSFHVAGSKGKGSVTGMLASILEAMGLRTAQYVSPHVSDFRERISLNRQFLAEDIYIEAGNMLRELVKTLGDTTKAEYRLFSGSGPDDAPPTYFELLTMCYFLCARLVRCDAMAVETGMGGEQDPTNIVNSAASLITIIELEHTEYLGNTLAEVAGAKAGIIKPGRPLILAEQSDEALGVFRKTAAELNSPLLYFPETAEIRDVAIREDGTDFTLAFKKPGYFDEPLRLHTGIVGAVQTLNAGLAIIALKTVYPSLDAETIRRGLKDFALPARFENLRPKAAEGKAPELSARAKAPELKAPVIIDGAHTEKSVELCANTFTALYGDGGILLFGCAAGKNAEAMAAILKPRFSKNIITAPGSYKGSDPKAVCELFARADGQAELLFMPETDKAIDYALEESLKTGLPVLGTGSFYLAANIRARFY
jgi:dihydrofolate synthase/folylpolyglutamate synthase